jgi:glycogen synthase
MHTAYWRQPAKHWYARLLMKPLAKTALARLRAENYPPPLAFRYTGCGSHFLKRRLAEAIPAFRDARVILCGLDLQLFATCHPHQTFNKPGRLKILFLGTLATHKGVQTAIAALPILQAARPDIRPELTLVGAGHPEFESRLRQQCQESGISSAVHFRGAVAKEMIPAILAEHDVLVVPSMWEEPFGRVLVEGMAAGVVVVGTASGGSAEILQHEVNGLVFPPEDTNALAKCLLRLIDDPALYARLAKAGKATAPKFDLQRMVDEMEQFFIETIATEKEAVS